MVGTPPCIQKVWHRAMNDGKCHETLKARLENTELVFKAVWDKAVDREQFMAVDAVVQQGHKYE